MLFDVLAFVMEQCDSQYLAWLALCEGVFFALARMGVEPNEAER